MQPMRRRMKLQQLFLKAHIETLKAQTHSPRYNALLGIPSFLKLRYPKNGWFIMEEGPMKMDDLGIPPF